MSQINNNDNTNNIDSQILLNKYEIKYQHDLCFNQQVIQMLTLLTFDNALPNVILYGPPGSGKKTIIKLFLKSIYNEDVYNITENIYTVETKKENNYYKNDVNTFPLKSKDANIMIKQSPYHIEINSNIINKTNSLVQILSYYTTQQSVLSYNFKNNKLFNTIVIYDIDNLNIRMQLALRRLIESKVNNCRFILTCSNINKIIDPIKSRCIVSKIKPPNNIELIRVILNICTKEKYRITLKDLIKLINDSDNNVSLCIIKLEILMNNIIHNNDYLNKINWFINWIITNKEEDKRKQLRPIVFSLLSQYIPGNKIIFDILYGLLKLNDSVINFKTKQKIIKLASFYENNIINVINKNDSICSFIIHVNTLLNFMCDNID